MTNNPKVVESYPGLDVRAVEGPVLELFLRVRDLVHRGHRLLTHPLSGSLKPGRIPYKTVILEAAKTGLDLESLRYIENSIEAYHRTAAGSPAAWPEPLLADYAVIDLSHVQAALESLGAQ
ncbi:MAG TPA: GrdX family protein [Bacillota bacterium]|mgnify:CR=1 FL=1|nr:GrdX family protein [Bacillota bacterium]